MAQSRRSKPLGLACAACFEDLAGVFASSGALHYAKILASLKIKNAISLTPLNCDQKALTLALNDLADAFVDRLSRLFLFGSIKCVLLSTKSGGFCSKRDALCPPQHKKWWFLF